MLTSPDFGGTSRSNAIARSCLPPLTMSPDWMNTTASSDVFSTDSWLTVDVSWTTAFFWARASCRVRMFLPGSTSGPCRRKTVRLPWVNGPDTDLTAGASAFGGAGGAGSAHDSPTAQASRPAPARVRPRVLIGDLLQT